MGHVSNVSSSCIYNLPNDQMSPKEEISLFLSLL
jgi:hypothetical protein